VTRVGWLLAAVGAALLPLLTTNTYYLYLGCTVGLLTVVTAGLNILAGFTGQISLGHAGFYALGAYAAALGVTRLGWPPWAAAAVGIGLAAVVGAGVAAAALRVTGPYLAMVTIAFGIVVEGLLVEWVPVTGGPAGIFNIPKAPLARVCMPSSVSSGSTGHDRRWILGPRRMSENRWSAEPRVDQQRRRGDGLVPREIVLGRAR